jgi:hypothetical protein
MHAAVQKTKLDSRLRGNDKVTVTRDASVWGNRKTQTKISIRFNRLRFIGPILMTKL